MASTRKNKVVKFKRGFKKPTHEQILNIIKEEIFKSKKLKYKNSFNKNFEKLLSHFQSLPDPTDCLDWLAQFNEQAQDCKNFIINCPISAKETLGTQKFIYYIQIGEFTDTKLKFSDLIEYSQIFFSKESVKLMPSVIKINKDYIKNSQKFLLSGCYGNKIKHKLLYRNNDDKNKIQIQAQSIHKLLKLIKPKDY
jgi:hypothetical protein